jgi:hypothetical protein
VFTNNRFLGVTCMFVVALFVAVALGGSGQSQEVRPYQPFPILTGKWMLDTGEIITISQEPGGKITGLFTPSVVCLNNSTRSILFTGKLKVDAQNVGTTTIEGDDFWACTRTPAMVTECGVQEVFRTKFRGTVSSSSITLESLRPHYDFEMVGGRRTNCRRNASKDEYGAPVTLTPLCRPSTPWFDRGSAPCQNLKTPEIIVDSLLASVRVCGSVVYSYRFTDSDQLTFQSFGTELAAHVKRQIGGIVCCDQFQQPAPRGGCDPRSDFDCDGLNNEVDTIPWPHNPAIPLPDMNIFSIPVGAQVAPFPEGLNSDDPGFLPMSSGCDCKWQLIQGVLNCGTGGQGHSYVATWKCPTSGRTMTTTKNAAASAPCP